MEGGTALHVVDDDGEAGGEEVGELGAEPVLAAGVAGLALLVVGGRAEETEDQLGHPHLLGLVAHDGDGLAVVLDGEVGGVDVAGDAGAAVRRHLFRRRPHGVVGGVDGTLVEQLVEARVELHAFPAGDGVVLPHEVFGVVLGDLRGPDEGVGKGEHVVPLRQALVVLVLVVRGAPIGDRCRHNCRSPFLRSGFSLRRGLLLLRLHNRQGGRGLFLRRGGGLLFGRDAPAGFRGGGSRRVRHDGRFFGVFALFFALLGLLSVMPPCV